MKKNLVEGEDFYYNPMGYIVLTTEYHLQRGDCCGNGCVHCPYEYKNVPEPKRSELLSSSSVSFKEEIYEKKNKQTI
ncbi:MAG TPA: DUF5522 domain-containing protein [Chitinophagaceae bacterium]|nr:DUF5522 domain-containing protein [Chitinophagaceae bacterium]